MPATVPIDRAVFTDLRLGDEHALEQLFRASYPTLAAEAALELGGDPASAPRVVETAFLRAWAQRQGFDSPEALERFLHRTIHEGAVRERSRRAALHRFEQHEGVHGIVARSGPVPADAAWQHVAAALHAPAVDAATAAHRRHDQARHGTAGHVAAIARRRPWAAPVAIAAVLGAFAVGGMRWMDRSSDATRAVSALAASEARVRTTRPGERATLELLDGTRAALGGSATLRIPRLYGPALRAVALDGSASFVVAPGSERPFHVQTPQAMLVATGTAFDVRAFAADGRTLVRVREGTVRVTAGDGTRSLAAGEALDVRPDGTMRPLAAAAAREAFAWQEGRLAVTNRPLREALVEVERWFGLTLHVRDRALLDRPVTLDVPFGATRALLGALEQGSGLAFAWEGEQMTLRAQP